MTQGAGAVVEDGHRVLVNPVEFGGLDQRHSFHYAAVRTVLTGVVAAVERDTDRRKSAQSIPVEREAPGPEGGYLHASGLLDEPLACGNQDLLLLERELAQVESLLPDVWQERLSRYVGPLDVQMQFCFLARSVYETDDLGQWAAAESSGEQRLDEEHARQAMLIEHFQLVGYAKVSSGRATVDILFECLRKFFVEVLPAVAPDFNVDREKDVQHAVGPPLAFY